MTRRTSDEGIDLIKRWEGLRTTAYDDNGAAAGGTWTIGYGHTGPEVRPGQTIGEAEAARLLREDLREAESIVERHVAVPLTDGQFAALVSFVFNVGPGRASVKDGFVTLRSGRPSTLLVRLNAGDYAGALAEFPKWTRGPAGTHAGLANRRAAESGLFARGAFVASSSVEPTPAPEPSIVRSPEGAGAILSGTALILSSTAEQLKPYTGGWSGIQSLFLALTVGGILLTAGAALWRLRRQGCL
jgi:lysozyme